MGLERTEGRSMVDRGNDGTLQNGPRETIPDPNVTFITTDKDWVAICHETQRDWPILLAD